MYIWIIDTMLHVYNYHNYVITSVTIGVRKALLLMRSQTDICNVVRSLDLRGKMSGPYLALYNVVDMTLPGWETRPFAIEVKLCTLNDVAT